MDLLNIPAYKLHNMYINREVSPVEVVEQVYDRIHKLNSQINAYISLLEEEALYRAKIVEKKFRDGEILSPLAGVPVAIKDNICLKGAPTSCGSRILANFYPPYDATVIKRLKERDVIFTGKTNMDEFAMGSSTENSAFGPTRNPWDTDRVPGGSSGGSAAAVSLSMPNLALGSDTGGSIRQPAAFCGVFGLKPTYGLVSRYGLVAFASSLDQIGPIGKWVTDVALMLNAIAGRDEYDSTSVQIEVPDYVEELKGEVKGLKVGLPENFYQKGLDADVYHCIRKVCRHLEALGVCCQEITLNFMDYALDAYYLIASAEASSNLARYDGVRYGYRCQEANNIRQMFSVTRKEGFGNEVKRRIMLGTYALSAGYYEAFYLKAQKVRTLIKRELEAAFNKFDLILLPTTPTTAFKIGEKIDDPLMMYLSDIYTIPVNLTGIPSVSLPLISSNGLPVGIQFLARHFQEGLLLKVSYALEKEINLQLSPPLQRRLPLREDG